MKRARDPLELLDLVRDLGIRVDDGLPPESQAYFISLQHCSRVKKEYEVNDQRPRVPKGKKEINDKEDN